MKKYSFIVTAVVALALASCGNKTSSEEAMQPDTVSFEQAQIEEKIMVELDSIAEVWGTLQPVAGVLNNGRISLSEDELKVKPDYLLSVDTLNNLTLLSQKYRALGMLVVDMNVAELYKMDVDAYKAAFTKVALDVNDPAIKTDTGKFTAEDVKVFYAAEKENNRLNLFWEVSAAILVEQLYVISQNVEKFLPAFDDKSASDFTYHVALLKLAMDDLAEYDNNIKGLVEVLAPLNELNAISVQQFKEQIDKMKPQIQGARASLLK